MLELVQENKWYCHVYIVYIVYFVYCILYFVYIGIGYINRYLNWEHELITTSIFIAHLQETIPQIPIDPIIRFPKIEHAAQHRPILQTSILLKLKPT